jgi:predicted nucleotidyltransferase
MMLLKYASSQRQKTNALLLWCRDAKGKRGVALTLSEAIQIMTREITAVLVDLKPTVYLYGSVVLDDFRLGWSDIDILVLTRREINKLQAEALVGLRQTLSERYPGNPYFRLFEGGMLSFDAFQNGKNERTVYWGTSGQRIADHYKLDSFGRTVLLEQGSLLHGPDLRERMPCPTVAEMLDDIVRHVQAARQYGFTVGWLLDLARGIYTARTGKIISKTAAGEWALENGLCPDADAMQIAVQIRKEPLSVRDKSMDHTVILRLANVLEHELNRKNND